MKDSNWWDEHDKDNDGIPDAMEDALDEARDIKRRIGMKPILIIILTVVVCASFGLQTWFYMDLKDEKLRLEQQLDWQQTEHEIELTTDMINERKQQLADLKKLAEDLKKNIDSATAERKQAEHTIKAKPYARRNEDEASKMDTNDLVRGFNALGYPAKPSNR